MSRKQDPEFYYELAMAAGRDVADRRMRKQMRTTWNSEDYSEAVEQTNIILDAWTGPQQRWQCG